MIGRCTTCTYDNCPTPSVKKKPGGNCAKWSSGKPTKINQRDIVKYDPKRDYFKNAIEGSTVTRRLDECPKCQVQMKDLTCSDCGYEFELEKA
jgi:hypothetical protein